MIASAMLTITQILSPPFRTVLWKSVGLTLALLVAIWFGLQGLLGYFLVLPFPWLETVISIISGMGLVIGLKALVAAILGGIGSLPGALLGGVLLAVLETMWTAYFPADYRDVFVFACLIAVLILRPQGLLGRARQPRV